MCSSRYGKIVSKCGILLTFSILSDVLTWTFSKKSTMVCGLPLRSFKVCKYVHYVSSRYFLISCHSLVLNLTVVDNKSAVYFPFPQGWNSDMFLLLEMLVKTWYPPLEAEHFRIWEIWKCCKFLYYTLSFEFPQAALGIYSAIFTKTAQILYFELLVVYSCPIINHQRCEQVKLKNNQVICLKSITYSAPKLVCKNIMNGKFYTVAAFCQFVSEYMNIRNWYKTLA